MSYEPVTHLDWARCFPSSHVGLYFLGTRRARECGAFVAVFLATVFQHVLCLAVDMFGRSSCSDCS